MPKITGYTPPWLCRPAPGAKIFSDPEPQSPVSPSKRASYFSNGNSSKNESVPTAHGPHKLIASRGSEIFTVVGNKIRWADLSKVKDAWEESTHGSQRQEEVQAYRTLVTPVYYQITQLVISPSALFLAICTEHTVHIAVLPDSSRLLDKDRSPLKLKTYQLGPTTHVIPESPLASVLWHPLSASTNYTDCLITVTAEAAVRVWEIDCTNHWSFERPALGIDLRKLADGTSSDQDFEPLGFGKNRGFSVDIFDMEVAAACFGGAGSADEDGWAAMTLWTAMSNGDVYALCPILPSKWRPSTTTIPSLSISAVSTMCTLDFETADRDSQKAAAQKLEWVQEIDNDGYVGADAGHGEVRHRPQNPSAIPRLQGPFEIGSFDASSDGEIADMQIIAARLDEEALLSGEEDYELVLDDFQFTIITLSTYAGTVLIALELEGVSGQWLPQKGHGTFSVPTSDAHELVLLEQLALSQSSTDASNFRPTFTRSSTDAYSLYVTSPGSIYSLCLREWASRIGIEGYGDGAVDAGLQTRLAVACQDKICQVQKLLTADVQSTASLSASLTSPIIIDDYNVGYMVLSRINNQACAALLDNIKASEHAASGPDEASESPLRNKVAMVKVLEEELPDPLPTRAPYTPSEALYRNQMAPLQELKHRIPTTRRSILTEKPLRLSPACLDIMALAHRTFSQQTSYVEKAAAELFRRCERLREELADQVKQMSELADRLQHIRASSEQNQPRSSTFDNRLQSAQDRQKQLLQRYEAIRRKSGRLVNANQELSTKEREWVAEIETLAHKTGINDDSSQSTETILERHEVAQRLAKELLQQSQSIMQNPPSPQKEPQNGDSPSLRNSTHSISSRLQRERIAEVMLMVEREGAIIDAVLSRLDKLSAS